MNFEILFLIIACIFSLFYAFRARRIIDYPHPDSYYTKKINRKRLLPDITNSAHIHGFWINLLGSAIGWFFIYILYSNLVQPGLKIAIKEISSIHVFIFIIGVIGIMGFLPFTLSGIISSLQYLIDKLIDKIK